MASVLDLIKHYQHAIEKYPNDEQKVLKSIDKLFGLGVTVQHLQDTGVGRTVNALRKEPGEVGTAARALVNKWKAMVAAEESDHDAQNNDTTNYNGNGNGKDYDHSSSKSRSRHNDTSYERTSETEVTSTSQINGNSSGSKRKYYSSEEEYNSHKKSKQSSSSENDEHKRMSVNVKREVSETDDDHEDSDDSHSSDSESEMSESSEDDRKGNRKIKEEPAENHKMVSKHSSHNHVDHKKENTSTKKSTDSASHSKSHSLESRHTSDKSSSRERSQSSHSHKHKYLNDKESSSEKKHKSDHGVNDKDKKKETNSSTKHKSLSDKHSHSEKNHSSFEKHRSSTEKHRSTSEKHSSSTEKHSKSSEKHKSSSGRDTKSDKHKDKPDKSDKHDSKSEKHLTQSHKSDKEKHKSSSEKEAEKHKSRESSSSSKEKHSSSIKEKSRNGSSSKEKSSDSHKSEKKSSSHESKSRSESKDKTSKGEDRSSEKKSKHKSSSSSSHKRDKSSSTKNAEDVPKTKSQINRNADSDDGIDCGSGASFAEALGMVSPAKPKKKSISIKDMSSPNSFSTDLSPASLLAPTAKLAPLPALEISALPEISPNYRPRPPPRLMPHFTDDEAMTQSISSKNQRTKVYSGNKVIGKIPSLYELCVHVLQEHIDDLEFTGGVPYEILKPIVDKASPQQLFMLEYHNPYLTEDTDHLWKAFCEKHFRNKKREEMEAWKEMYMRCQEEQEDKLKSLTANIKLTQEAKKAPIKQTKMAYVDSVVKPPRNVARKQAQHGTAFASSASPAARVAALASAPNVLRGGAVRPPAAGPVSSSSFKPKKAPLMAKALQFMRGRKR